MEIYTFKEPKKKTNNILYNCPHSGELFPDGFFDNVRLSKHVLLSSGDSFVDQLFIDSVNSGSSFISNQYARSFIDTNREAYELDPTMFSGDITEKLNDQSNKVRLGFGSIAKYAVNRDNIYKDRIPFSDALNRLNQYYFPIHAKIDDALISDFDQFGYSLLIDCHSMPSYEFLGQFDRPSKQPDIILGDLFGTSCDPAITSYIEKYFKSHNLKVASNSPFAGGYNTRNYGSPENRKHAIQIEIKKSLYMDEMKRKPKDNFGTLKKIMDELSSNLNDDINEIL